MEKTVLPRIEKTPDHDSIFLASLILQDVYRTVMGIHMVVAVLFRYVNLGLSITASLIGLIASTASEST